MSTIFDRLIAATPEYRDPLQEIDWNAADPDLPWLPEKMISIANTPLWQTLDDAQRLRVSRVEFARLCAAGLWLEGLLVHRVTHKGFVAADTKETHIVLQEVREETGHGLMFLKMIDKAGMGGKHLLGPTRLLTSVAKMLDPVGPGFWAMVYLGESITDNFAIMALRVTSEDGEEICPVARQVMKWHHNDEARHIAAAKAMLHDKLDTMSGVERAFLKAVVSLLVKRFLRATLFPSLPSLEALGLADPEGVWRAAHADADRHVLARACADPALTTLFKRLGQERAAPVDAS